MKKLVKISLCTVIISMAFISCTSIPATPVDNNGPLEPGQTEMKSQGQDNAMPEPGQTEMKVQNGN